MTYNVIIYFESDYEKVSYKFSDIYLFDKIHTDLMMWVMHPLADIAVTNNMVFNEIVVFFNMNLPYCYTVYDEWYENHLYIEYDDVQERYVKFSNYHLL